MLTWPMEAFTRMNRLMSFDEILAKDQGFSDLDLRLERISDQLTEVLGISLSMRVPDFSKRTKVIVLNGIH